MLASDGIAQDHVPEARRKIGALLTEPPDVGIDTAAPGVRWNAPEMQLDVDTQAHTLEGLLELAARSNPTIVQAQYQITGQLAKAQQAGLYPNPLLFYMGENIGVEGTAGEWQGAQLQQRFVTAHKLQISRDKYLQRAKVAEHIAVAQSSVFEFIANNPGDWMFHCHMVHHMMNHMVRQVGPRIREDSHVDAYLTNLDNRPAVDMQHESGFQTPGYPQAMQGMEMSEQAMKAIWSRRDVQGMRATWPKSVHGLMTTLRVLPDDLYQQVMETDNVPKGAIFQEIVNRFGTPAMYQKAPMMPMK